MSTPQLERIGNHLEQLKLHKSRERLEALLQEATKRELGYTEFLDRMLGEEVASKTDKAVSLRTKMARFPYVKSIESFDFKYQPSLDEKQIREPTWNRPRTGPVRTGRGSLTDRNPIARSNGTGWAIGIYSDLPGRRAPWDWVAWQSART